MSNDKMDRCTGLRFRGFESIYFDKNTLTFIKKEGFRLLKRSACKCMVCRHLKDDLFDSGDDIVNCVNWNLTFGVTEIENGAEYELDLIEYPNEELPEFRMIKVK